MPEPEDVQQDLETPSEPPPVPEGPAPARAQYPSDPWEGADEAPETPRWWEARAERPIQRVWDPATGTWREPEVQAQPADERAGMSPGRSALLGGVAGAIASALLVLVLTQLPVRGPAVVQRQAPGVAAERSSEDIVVQIAERAKPWVVHINTTLRRPGAFGTQEARGAGSGVIVRSDGHLVTNAHVVEGATEVEVILASGESLPGEIVGADLDTDVAVVKLARTDLPSALIGSAGDLRVGELAVAIGSPLGLSHSVTSGIISALGRTTTSPSNRPLVDMIQTDASITRGNSGGALINGQGALIGINTAIAVDADVGAEGIAFAIPIDIAMRVAEELIATGRATHPYIGINGTTIDPETARQFGANEGARVVNVVPGGPADDAGIQPGDIIVNFGGESVESMEDLITLIAQRTVGEAVEVEVVRPGTDGRQRLRVTIGDRPAGR